ncbi:CPBP family intramembrane glutamic endopeptidase [Aquimarina rubra]|uniref:CPBP family intramembrane glutamic endopeptidase n=1 Tax=Aquimarina rubra TaxID=1920033 RepID=A0ABW5LK11_9FLAO
MKNIQNISPGIFAIITLVVISSIVLLPIDTILLKMSLSDFHSEYIGLAIKMASILIISYGFIKKMKIEPITGLSSAYDWKFKYLNMIPVYLIIIGVSGIIATDVTEIHIGNVVLLLFACLTVGFAEEFLFRGVLQSVFLKKYVHSKNGILISIVLPAIVFGLFHLINLTKNDNVSAVLTQVVFATFIGFFFGVLVLKTNKIIPVAFTHGLINFFFSILLLPGIKDIENIVPLEETGNSIAPIILTLPLLVIGLFVAKKIKKETVVKKLNESFN